MSERPAPAPPGWAEDMHVVESDYPQAEPEWDDVSICRTNWRPQGNGDLVSLCSLVRPLSTEAETARFVRSCARSIAAWICANADRFGAEDRFQIVIGWPITVRGRNRQIIKTAGTRSEIEAMASGRSPIELREAWANGVFEQ